MIPLRCRPGRRVPAALALGLLASSGTAASSPRTWLSQPSFGMPETNQLVPLSARIIPYTCSAFRTTRACAGNVEMSTLAFSRTRRPIGGRDVLVESDAKCRAG